MMAEPRTSVKLANVFPGTTTSSEARLRPTSTFYPGCHGPFPSAVPAPRSLESSKHEGNQASEVGRQNLT